MAACLEACENEHYTRAMGSMSHVSWNLMAALQPVMLHRKMENQKQKGEPPVSEYHDKHPKGTTVKCQ